MVTETFPSFRDEVIYNGRKGKRSLSSVFSIANTRFHTISLPMETRPDSCSRDLGSLLPSSSIACSPAVPRSQWSRHPRTHDVRRLSRSSDPTPSTNAHISASPTQASSLACAADTRMPRRGFYTSGEYNLRGASEERN